LVFYFKKSDPQMGTSASETESTGLRAVSHVVKSDIGLRREENKDSYGILLENSFRFYIVADGMGGVKGGAVASQSAIQVITECLQPRKELGVQDIVTAVTHANSAVFEKGIEDPELAGMGTTLVGLCFTQRGLFVVNVGDSRAYRVREKEISQLTEDHTLVTELLRSGAISAEQVENHPVSHMLTRSLGPTPVIEVDCWISDEDPVQDDVYLLCSDGLYNLVENDEIAEIVDQHPLEEASDKLVSLANERGGTDNITVILIKVEDELNIVRLEEDKESENGVDMPFMTDTLELKEGIGAEYISSGNGDQDSAESEDPDERLNGDTLNGKEESSEEKGVDTMELEKGSSEKKEAPQEEQAEEKPAQGESVGHISGSPDLLSRLAAKSKVQYKEAATAKTEKYEEEPKEEPVFGVPEQKSSFLADKHVWVALFFALLAVVFSVLWYRDSSKTDTYMVRKPDKIKQDLLTKSPESGMVKAPTWEAGRTGRKSDRKTGKPGADSSRLGKTKPGAETDGPAKDVEDELNDIDFVLQSDDQTAGKGDNSKAEETDDAVEGQDSHGFNEAELENIRKRKQELIGEIVVLTKKQKAFEKPLSGNIGDILRETTGERDFLVQERNEIRSKMEYATRRLAVWYGRKKRLQTTDALKLATEVAASSEAVKEKQEVFQEVTWRYLKETDALRYKPDDEEQKFKVQSLLKERKSALQDLEEEVQKAIADEVRAADHLISELTLQRDTLDEKVKKNKQEEEYIKILIGTDQAAKDNLQIELKEKIKTAQTELNELNELVSDEDKQPAVDEFEAGEDR
jgi:PPM family protein phosphatase